MGLVAQQEKQDKDQTQAAEQNGTEGFDRLQETAAIERETQHDHEAAHDQTPPPFAGIDDVGQEEAQGHAPHQDGGRQARLETVRGRQVQHRRQRNAGEGRDQLPPVGPVAHKKPGEAQTSRQQQGGQQVLQVGRGELQHLLVNQEQQNATGRQGSGQEQDRQARMLR